jgi:hypothetical protein
MFLVKDSSLSRENRIIQFLPEDPALSALLAVIHFEWTTRRAIIALSISPKNIAVRRTLRNCYGLEKYKDVWKEEVFPNIQKRLPEVVNNWERLNSAFRLRHGLVHGSTSCGVEYARERALWAIESANNVRAVCVDNGINLDSRLPVRRSAKL